MCDGRYLDLGLGIVGYNPSLGPSFRGLKLIVEAKMDLGWV